MEMGEAQAAAREELERRLAAQLEGLFAADVGDEGALARCFVAALGPGDAQEQALAVQMALSHQLAVARIGAARREELPERPQQIELGLAARFMTLHLRPPPRRQGTGGGAGGETGGANGGATGGQAAVANSRAGDAAHDRGGAAGNVPASAGGVHGGIRGSVPCFRGRGRA
jgi:hypothetical protein